MECGWESNPWVAALACELESKYGWESNPSVVALACEPESNRQDSRHLSMWHLLYLSICAVGERSQA